MVKGVNKSIIEISDTGSKYFSRVILFVAPEFIDKKSKKLSIEAENVIRKIQISTATPTLREAIQYEKKRKLKLILFGTVIFFTITAAVTLLLIF